MTRRHLLLSYCFPPDAAPEAYLAAKFVTSVPGTSDVVAAQPRADRIDPSLVDYAESSGAKVHRVTPGAVGKSLGAIGPTTRLPDRLVTHNAAALGVARRLLSEGRHTHLISWSQWHSIHLVARALRRRGADLPWVARFSDPWSDNPFARYGRVTGALNRRWEREVIGHADRIVFTNEETRELVMAKYPASWQTRTRVIPHSFDPGLYPDSPTTSSDELVVRYVGTLYGPRRADPLIRAIERLRRSSPHLLENVRFEFVGRIPASHVPHAPKVDVRAPVDHRTSLGLMRSADLLLVIDAPAERSVFLPSKLIEYIGSGRPILAITSPGPAQRLVERLGGWVANPTDDGQVASALTEVLAYVRDRSVEPWGSSEVRRHFHVDRVAKEYERLLDEVA